MRASETSLGERDGILLAYVGEVLVSASNSITKLKRSLVAKWSFSDHRPSIE